MRFGRSVVAAAAALASAGALAFTPVGPAGAAVNLVGVGTTTCSTSYIGTLQFLQALKNGGTLTSEEVELSITFGGCTGGTPVPTAGRYVAKGVLQGAGANNCANWFATPGSFKNRVFTLDGGASWTSTPAVTGSNVSFPSMRIKTGTGGHFAVLLPIPPGSGTVTGSYSTTSVVTLRIAQAQTYTAVTTACSGPGLTAMHVAQANSGGSSTGTW